MHMKSLKVESLAFCRKETSASGAYIVLQLQLFALDHMTCKIDHFEAFMLNGPDRWRNILHIVHHLYLKCQSTKYTILKFEWKVKFQFIPDTGIILSPVIPPYYKQFCLKRKYWLYDYWDIDYSTINMIRLTTRIPVIFPKV